MITFLWWLIGPGSLSEMNYYGNLYRRQSVIDRYHKWLWLTILVDIFLLWFLF